MCYNKIGDSMRIEKWMYNGEEIEVPILDEEDIDKNLDINNDLEKTIELSEVINNIGDNNE